MSDPVVPETKHKRQKHKKNSPLKFHGMGKVGGLLTVFMPSTSMKIKVRGWRTVILLQVLIEMVVNGKFLLPRRGKRK